jgi:hypothetical protein
MDEFLTTAAPYIVGAIFAMGPIMCVLAWVDAAKAWKKKLNK